MNGRTDLPLPTIGSVWRARRKGEQDRTVRVLEVSGPTGFVRIQTLTKAGGGPPARKTVTRTRAARWHSDFEPVDED